MNSIGDQFSVSFAVSSIKISESNFEFLQQPVSQTVQEGGQVTFNCGVSTHRKISYQWQHNNRTIRTDRQPRFTIRSDGSLRITNANLDDSGIYQCTAVAKAKRSQAVRKKAKSRPATLLVEGESSLFITKTLTVINSCTVWYRT